MIGVTLNDYLAVGGLLFVIGLAGLIIRRDLLVIFMCLEIMCNGVNLTLAAFSHFHAVRDGEILVALSLVIMVAELAVGLALLLVFFRLRQTTRAEDLTALKF